LFSPELVDLLKQYELILSSGAGTGYLENRAKENSVDIIATDKYWPEAEKVSAFGRKLSGGGVKTVVLPPIFGK
jgi:hypothetical protein